MRLQILVAALAILPLASADTLTLRDGRTVEGQYLGGSARQIRWAVGDGVQTFDVTDIADLHFEAAKTSAAQPAPKPAPAAQPAVSQPTGSAQAETAVARAPEPAPERQKILHVEPAVAAAAPAGATGIELPTGTAIVIRMIDAVDSKQARTGQTFRASVDEPVLLGDRTAIPRGADVVTRLMEVKDPNKITGGGLLTLALTSVNVNGRTVDVNSESVTQAGESGKGDSAKVIGGTAALGAIIGAIAGGGKGAAIGAVSGAGAGTAVRVLTNGAEVKIPSETRLTFTLQSPVKL
ncbi:MAG TPA: hypothetical protein VF767_10425 [Bryobacteraceae bacterium]